MNISSGYDLTGLNTFGVSARAQFFVEINSEEDLKKLMNRDEFKNNKKLFLGGGSNILITKDWDGIVILNKLKGIEVLEEDEDSVLLKAMGGEIWHDLVTFSVEHGWWGIENLALIPGSVGAAPMQNIGAYGTELKNVLETVEAYEIETGEKRIFTKEESNFGYRDSIFKQELKGKYFISAIVIKLSKIENKNINYKVLKEHLDKNQITVKSSKDISDAVSTIRGTKLPDPKIIGNAGSFFKNVFVDRKTLDDLLKDYPEMPYFEEENQIKIPAAWLIEQAGWKGKKVGNAGVHEKQALVLVNYGGATGKELYNLAEQIIDSVYSKFGIKLTPEVNLI